MQELPIDQRRGSPRLSVQLPSRGRAETLARCIRALAGQTLEDDEFEVIVGLDGDDERAATLARQAWAGRPAQNLRILTFPRQGHLPIRAAMVGLTDAPLLVFLNDDVIAEPGLLSAHLAAHQEAAGRYPRGIMVAGATPWTIPDRDTLFDRLVRETALVFFYDEMERAARQDPGSARWRDWGFRHFWTLNASAPRRAVEGVGGFRALPDTYGHEDIELAFRLQERLAMPVLYRPEARGRHDHRYTPADVMRREVNLGAASWRFARASPAFGVTLFGRDITSEQEIAYSRAFVERERAGVDRLASDFQSLAGLDAGAASPELLGVLSRQFLLPKRYLWRRGLLQAMEQERDDTRRAGDAPPREALHGA